MRIADLSRNFSLDEYGRDRHAGTHVDAPAYAIDRGKMIEDFQLERFICDAVLLDLSNKTPGEPIDDEDFEAAEESAGVAIREGEAVILYTAPETSSPRPNVYISRNAAEYLEFKGASLVGIDSANIDDSGASDLTAHRILLGKEILVLEGLTNLDSIDLERFRLVCFPLKLTGTISPVRAVAILEE